MKTIKILDQDVARVSDHDSSYFSYGFLFCHYDIGASVEGFVRTVYGYESAAHKGRVIVPMVMLCKERQEKADEEWKDGVKYVVLNGVYEGYVGYLRLRTIL